MSWHKTSLFGKVMLGIACLAIGFGLGQTYSWSKGVKVGAEVVKDTAQPEGNTINMNVDPGKVKDGGSINLNLSDVDQTQVNEGDSVKITPETKKKKKWWQSR